MMLCLFVIKTPKIDTTNSTVGGEVDVVESGSSAAGTTYTTTSSYSSY